MNSTVEWVITAVAIGIVLTILITVEQILIDRYRRSRREREAEREADRPADREW